MKSVNNFFAGFKKVIMDKKKYYKKVIKSLSIIQIIKRMCWWVCIQYKFSRINYYIWLGYYYIKNKYNKNNKLIIKKDIDENIYNENGKYNRIKEVKFNINNKNIFISTICFREEIRGVDLKYQEGLIDLIIAFFNEINFNYIKIIEILKEAKEIAEKIEPKEFEVTIEEYIEFYKNKEEVIEGLIKNKKNKELIKIALIIRVFYNIYYDNYITYILEGIQDKVVRVFPFLDEILLYNLNKNAKIRAWSYSYDDYLLEIQENKVKYKKIDLIPIYELLLSSDPDETIFFQKWDGYARSLHKKYIYINNNVKEINIKLDYFFAEENIYLKFLNLIKNYTNEIEKINPFYVKIKDFLKVQKGEYIRNFFNLDQDLTLEQKFYVEYEELREKTLYIQKDLNKEIFIRAYNETMYKKLWNIYTNYTGSVLLVKNENILNETHKELEKTINFNYGVHKPIYYKDNLWIFQKLDSYYDFYERECIYYKNYKDYKNNNFYYNKNLIYFFAPEKSYADIYIKQYNNFLLLKKNLGNFVSNGYKIINEINFKNKNKKKIKNKYLKFIISFFLNKKEKKIIYNEYIYRKIIRYILYIIIPKIGTVITSLLSSPVLLVVSLYILKVIFIPVIALAEEQRIFISNTIRSIIYYYNMQKTTEKITGIIKKIKTTFSVEDLYKFKKDLPSPSDPNKIINVASQQQKEINHANNLLTKYDINKKILVNIGTFFIRSSFENRKSIANFMEKFKDEIPSGIVFLPQEKIPNMEQAYDRDSQRIFSSEGVKNIFTVNELNDQYKDFFNRKVKFSILSYKKQVNGVHTLDMGLEYNGKEHEVESKDPTILFLLPYIIARDKLLAQGDSKKQVDKFIIEKIVKYYKESKEHLDDQYMCISVDNFPLKDRLTLIQIKEELFEKKIIIKANNLLPNTTDKIHELLEVNEIEYQNFLKSLNPEKLVELEILDYKYKYKKKIPIEDEELVKYWRKIKTNINIKIENYYKETLEVNITEEDILKAKNKSPILTEKNINNIEEYNNINNLEDF